MRRRYSIRAMHCQLDAQSTQYRSAGMSSFCRRAQAASRGQISTPTHIHPWHHAGSCVDKGRELGATSCWAA